MTSGRIWRVFEDGHWSDSKAVALEGVQGSQSVENIRDRVASAEASLRELCIPPSSIVGVALSDPVLMAVFMLAISKCGYTYLPIDPQAHETYVRQQAKMMRCRVLFQDKFRNNRSDRERAGSTSLEVEHFNGRTYATGRENHIEYVITTSGSTGRPKGVPIQTAQLDALLHSPLGANLLANHDAAQVLNTFRPNFDMWIWAHLIAWAQGRPVRTVDGIEMAFGADALAGPTTALFGVPSLIRAWGSSSRRRALSKMKVVLAGFAGEAFHIKHFAAVRATWPQATVANLYGPAEATMLASGYFADPHNRNPHAQDGVVSIGNFIPELHVRLTETGEAELTGPTVFQGYIDGSDDGPMTASTETARAYLTGDLLSSDDSENYYYHGRIDDQVKTAGYRVNLMAVDSRIRATGLVDEVVTFLDERGRLAGYVAPKSVDLEAVMEALRLVSPRWELPTWLEAVRMIPRGATGKAQRKQFNEEGTD